MASENEQKALTQIREYIGAAYTLDALREAGWTDWIRHFEVKGVDMEPPEAASGGNGNLDSNGILRQEMSIWRVFPAFRAGKLTLRPGRLVWQGMGAFIINRKTEEMTLSEANFWLGPRWSSILFLGFWFLLINLIKEATTPGGFQHPIQVDTPKRTYHFAVKDARSWLHDIARAGGRVHLKEQQ